MFVASDWTIVCLFDVKVGVLRMCSSQLCEILCTIFNLSFQCGVVPDIWKSFCIVPVPKIDKVGSINDLRPVTLTSVALITYE